MDEETCNNAQLTELLDDENNGASFVKISYTVFSQSYAQRL